MKVYLTIHEKWDDGDEASGKPLPRLVKHYAFQCSECMVVWLQALPFVTDRPCDCFCETVEIETDEPEVKL